jgi:hypothetical protein
MTTTFDDTRDYVQARRGIPSLVGATLAARLATLAAFAVILAVVVWH